MCSSFRTRARANEPPHLALCIWKRTFRSAFPAKAGIQPADPNWPPAFAGDTVERDGQKSSTAEDRRAANATPSIVIPAKAGTQEPRWQPLGSGSRAARVSGMTIEEVNHLRLPRPIPHVTTTQ